MSSYTLSAMDSEQLEKLAANCYMTPTAYIRMMVTDPPRFAAQYAFVVKEFVATQKARAKAEAAEQKARAKQEAVAQRQEARKADPLVQIKVDLKKAKVEAADRIQDLKNMLYVIEPKLGFAEGELSSPEAEHEKIVATRVPRTCPTWQTIQNTYMQTNDRHRYKTELRRIKGRIEAEIKHLKRDPLHVQNVPVDKRIPM